MLIPPSSEEENKKRNETKQAKTATAPKFFTETTGFLSHFENMEMGAVAGFCLFSFLCFSNETCVHGLTLTLERWDRFLAWNALALRHRGACFSVSMDGLMQARISSCGL
jgi:hypothetical protein